MQIYVVYFYKSSDGKCELKCLSYSRQTINFAIGQSEVNLDFHYKIIITNSLYKALYELSIRVTQSVLCCSEKLESEKQIGSLEGFTKKIIDRRKRELEHDLLVELLIKTNGHISKAAEIMEVNRKTIYRKIGYYVADRGVDHVIRYLFPDKSVEDFEAMKKL